MPQPASNAILALVLVTAAACSPDALSTAQPAKAVDATPPTLRIVTPTDGQRVQGDVLTVEVEYADDGSGVVSTSFRALVNARDVAGSFDQHSRGASGRVRVPGGLPLGDNTLTVEVADRAGNVARASSRFFNAGTDWLAVTAVVRSDRGVEPLALSPDGRLLAGGARNGAVRMWTLTDAGAQERATLKAHRGAVSALAFSPDGKFLASGGWDGAIHVWSVSGEQQRERAVLIGHDSTVSSFAFGTDDTTLMSGSWDGTVRVWRLASSGSKDSELSTLRSGTNKVYALSLSPDGRTMASGTWEGAVVLWDVATAHPRRVATLNGHLLKVFAVAFGRDGSALASGALDKKIDVWDSAGPHASPRVVLEGHRQEIAALVFTEGGTLLSIARDGVRLWNISSAKTLKEVGLLPSTRSMALAAGGRYVAVGDQSGTVYVLRRVEATP